MNNQKNKLVDLAPDLGDVGQLHAENFAVQKTTPARASAARKKLIDKNKSPITGKALSRPTRIPKK